MKVVGISDLGLHRRKNEDSYLINQNLGLFVICDGMGGHRGGDVASQMAINSIDQISRGETFATAGELLEGAIRQANTTIWQQGNVNPEWEGMGTTVTAALLEGEKLTVANVGDSSLYIIRNDNIRKITTDHTLAEQMVQEGLLGLKDIRSSAYNHILTRALGVEEDVQIDLFDEQVEAGDIIMLCSDGLSDMLNENEMISIIQDSAGKEEQPDIMARTLLRHALDRGGYDNITIIIVKIED